MDKTDLLRLIAEEGYNVGFGAKKHFATYEIVEKAPGWISLGSFAIAVFALFIDDIANNKFLAALLIIIGVGGMFITYYNDKKEEYRKAGNALTSLLSELKDLYFRTKSSNASEFSAEEELLKNIRARYYASSITKQIFLSDWMAHWKFFWQQQIAWIDSEKNFKFFRDKLPLSFIVFVSLAIALALCKFFPVLVSYFNSFRCLA